MPHFYLPNPGVCDVKPITTIKWFEQQDILQFKGDRRFRIKKYNFNKSKDFNILI